MGGRVRPGVDQPRSAGSWSVGSGKELTVRGQQGAGRLHRGLKGVGIAPLEVAVDVLGSVGSLDHDLPFGMVKVKELVLFFQQMGYSIVLSCALPYLAACRPQMTKNCIFVLPDHHLIPGSTNHTTNSTNHTNNESAFASDP